MTNGSVTVIVHKKKFCIVLWFYTHNYTFSILRRITVNHDTLTAPLYGKLPLVVSTVAEKRPQGLAHVLPSSKTAVGQAIDGKQRPIDKKTAI